MALISYSNHYVKQKSKRSSETADKAQKTEIESKSGDSSTLRVGEILRAVNSTMEKPSCQHRKEPITSKLLTWVSI